MQLCKARLKTTGDVRAGLVDTGGLRFLDLAKGGVPTLSSLLHSPDPADLVQLLVEETVTPYDEVTLLPPLDHQEVWAAGVTYQRSQEARERESVGAAQFYHLVYDADRPELFLKATPRRVVGPDGRVRIRRDSRWSVPEPELALVIAPDLRIVGYTIGNDMSARDIEGENPLYLPQAKVHDACCALGPVVTLARDMPPLKEVTIRLTIERDSSTVFDGSTSVSRMKRTPEELVQWLARDNSFPDGVILLTGTGIVPPDHFTLMSGDLVHIQMDGIGRLTNVVEQVGS